MGRAPSGRPRRSDRSRAVGQRNAVAGFALARAAFGLALFAAPERVARGWLGNAAGDAQAQVAIRGLGARDIALGAGTAAAAARCGDPLPWLVVAVGCDCADIAAAFAGRSALPPRSAAGTALLAGASVVAGAALALRSR